MRQILIGVFLNVKIVKWIRIIYSAHEELRKQFLFLFYTGFVESHESRHCRSLCKFHQRKIVRLYSNFPGVTYVIPTINEKSNYSEIPNSCSS